MIVLHNCPKVALWKGKRIFQPSSFPGNSIVNPIAGNNEIQSKRKEIPLMPIFLSIEQIHDLLEIARRSSARDYAILRLAANTGLRESDILNLKKSKMITPSGEVVTSLTLKIKKTGKMTEKALSEATRQAIAGYLKSAPRSEWLFPGEFPDRPLSRKTMDRIYKRYLQSLLGNNANLAGSSTHTLRRSTAFLISEKQGVESASVFLGHTSLANTIFYLNRHRLQKRADEAIQDMDL
jgi:integrase/recombinase XerD